MKALKIVLVVVVALVVVQLALTGINIWQKGGPTRADHGADPRVDPAKATDKDIEKLDKAAVFQLFYAAPAPKFEDVKGEYNAKTLPVGILAASADFYTHNFFGPGRWVGKAFLQAEKRRGGDTISSRARGKTGRKRSREPGR